VHLPTDEREPRTKLGESVLQSSSQRGLDRPLAGPFGEVEEVEDVGILDDLLRLVGVDRVEVIDEVGGGGADPAVQAGRDVVLQHLPGPRVAGVVSGVPVPQVRVVELVEQCAHVTPRQFPHRLWEIGSAGQAAANARMYCRFVADNPVMVANSRRRSAASWRITPDPHGWDCWRSRISLPIRQFIRTSSLLATRAARNRAVRTSTPMRQRALDNPRV